MKASILTIGTELLFGQIVNTNSAYLSQQLQSLGIDVLYHFSVGDNENRIAHMIKTAFLDTDLIIATGGLGPTQDDATKEVIAHALGDELVLDEKALAHIKDYFLTIGREMTANNEKQAYLPSTAIPLYNSVGTAPGFILEKNGKIIIALPGPPQELKPMYSYGALPFLRKKVDAAIYYKLIFVVGIGESQLETLLLPLINAQTDPTIATYAKPGECAIRLTSKRRNEAEARRAVEAVESKMLDIIGKNVSRIVDMHELDVAKTDGQRAEASIYKALFDLLAEKNLVISTAESCTGGMIAKGLTDIPGSSKVFYSGFVTYSNEAKVSMLGIDPKRIDIFGAVSEEVAGDMAVLALENTRADISVSVTGIAGPDGGSEEKPIGLAYIGIASRLGGVEVYKNIVPDKGRGANRTRTAVQVCGRVIAYIKENF